MLRANGLMPYGAAASATAALGNGTVLFTIAGGARQLRGLRSACVTPHGHDARTVRYSRTPTVGHPKTIPAAGA